MSNVVPKCSVVRTIAASFAHNKRNLNKEDEDCDKCKEKRDRHDYSYKLEEFHPGLG